MEITSLPFLTTEDLSSFFNAINANMFPDLDDDNHIDFAADLSPVSNKRRRLAAAATEDEHESKARLISGEMNGIFTPLLLLEEEEDATKQQDRSCARRSRPASTSAPATGQQHRRLWVKDRSKDWWDQRNHPDFPEDQFRKDFRMSRSTFEFICNELETGVTKKNTMLRDAIPVRQRVAVCIWRLATGEPLRLVSKRFGLGISTCHKLVLEVCSAIKSLLMPKFVSWPAAETDDEAIQSGFESLSGIKNVAGAMYTTHVPIIAPKVNVSAYFNRRHTERNQRTSYSITVQGVADPRGVFRDVCIGWPGSMADERVLEKSAIFQRAARGELGCRDGGRVVVGGPGYPLLDWLLVPYSRHNLTWAQHAFNGRVEAARRPAREAFSRLKARWSCLQKRTEVKLQDLPVVLGACCTLHNICEIRGDLVDPEHAFEVFDDDMLASELGSSSSSSAAAQTRDQIAHHLLHHSSPGTAFL